MKGWFDRESGLNGLHKPSKNGASLTAVGFDHDQQTLDEPIAR
jgi:hypothetical protein